MIRIGGRRRGLASPTGDDARTIIEFEATRGRRRRRGRIRHFRIEVNLPVDARWVLVVNRRRSNDPPPIVTGEA